MLCSLYPPCIKPTCMTGATIRDIPVSGGTAFPDVGTVMFYVILAPERCDSGGINASAL